jgi:two-component system cell cycle sensor histidine kinase/response regulator CckA
MLGTFRTNQGIVTNEEVLFAVAGFEELPVAGAIFDLDGTVLAVNARARHALGRTREQILGRKIGELGAHLRSVWRDFVAAGEHAGEMTVQSAHGARTFEYTLSTRAAGSRWVVLAFAMDITRHKEEQSQSIERERAIARGQRLESLGLVAGGMAHELNNLLVSVVAEASILREEATSDAMRDAIGRIDFSSKRMTQLTQQLLAYTGRGRFVTTLVDPDLLLDQKREPLARRVPPTATLEVFPGAGAVAVEADRSLLRQVIRDLVENATEALREGNGHVRVASRVVELDGKPWWEIEVKDNGIGMDAQTQARIFDPFFTTKPNRHGLGLSAVLGIVRRLGGDLEVSSELGLGSKFRVRLPIVPGVAPPRRRSTSEQPVPLAMAGLRVLLADDESTVRATVSRLLTRRGALPVLASTGAEAEELLRREKFDLILCDVVMPEKTGYQLVPIARELQPGVPMILMSGYSEQPTAVEQPDAFLEKPFTAGGLEEVIRSVLSPREQL